MSPTYVNLANIFGVISLSICIFYGLRHISQNGKSSAFAKHFYLLWFIGSFLLISVGVVNVKIGEYLEVSQRRASVEADLQTIERMKIDIERNYTYISSVAYKANNVDKLISQIESEYELLAKKIEQLERLIADGNQSLVRVNKLQEFMLSGIQAQNDDAVALSYINDISKSNSEYAPVAMNIVATVQSMHALPVSSWVLPPDFKYENIVHLGADEIEDVFSNVDYKYHTAYVEAITRSKNHSTYEKMSLYESVIKNSRSQKAKVFAARAFVNLAQDENLKYTGFQFDSIMEWWEKNKNRIHREKDGVKGYEEKNLMELHH